MAVAARGRAQVRGRAKSRRPSRSTKQGHVLESGKLLAARRVGLTSDLAITIGMSLALVGLIIVLAAGGVAQAINGRVGQFVSDEAAKLGFVVKTVSVQGAAPFTVEAIERASGLKAGAPILSVDLADVRQRVREVGWVDDVKVIRLLPNTIVLAVTERQRLAVWQASGRNVVIDAAGRPIIEANAARFTDLPLVVGAGAADEAPMMLQEIARRPRLQARLLALIRIDQRRWNIQLRDGLVIQLPADHVNDALTRLDRLDARTQIFDLGLARLDLRTPEMMLVRRKEGADAGPSDLVADGT